MAKYFAEPHTYRSKTWRPIP